jgi:hypothetical protein
MSLSELLQSRAAKNDIKPFKRILQRIIAEELRLLNPQRHQEIMDLLLHMKKRIAEIEAEL